MERCCWCGRMCWYVKGLRTSRVIDRTNRSGYVTVLILGVEGEGASSSVMFMIPRKSQILAKPSAYPEPSRNKGNHTTNPTQGPTMGPVP